MWSGQVGKYKFSLTAMKYYTVWLYHIILSIFLLMDFFYYYMQCYKEHPLTVWNCSFSTSKMHEYKQFYMVEPNSIVYMTTLTFNFWLCNGWEMVSGCFYLHLPIVSEVRPIFICSLAIWISSNVNFPLIFCAHPE